ncbi:MAG: hypothetical protein ACRDAQ_05170, partial [Cetobacterium sp.]
LRPPAPKAGALPDCAIFRNICSSTFSADRNNSTISLKLCQQLFLFLNNYLVLSYYLNKNLMFN